MLVMSFNNKDTEVRQQHLPHLVRPQMPPQLPAAAAAAAAAAPQEADLAVVPDQAAACLCLHACNPSVLAVAMCLGTLVAAQ